MATAHYTQPTTEVSFKRDDATITVTLLVSNTQDKTHVSCLVDGVQATTTQPTSRRALIAACKAADIASKGDTATLRLALHETTVRGTREAAKQQRIESQQRMAANRSTAAEGKGYKPRSKAAPVDKATVPQPEARATAPKPPAKISYTIRELKALAKAHKLPKYGYLRKAELMVALAAHGVTL